MNNLKNVTITVPSGSWTAIDPNDSATNGTIQCRAGQFYFITSPTVPIDGNYAGATLANNFNPWSYSLTGSQQLYVAGYNSTVTLYIVPNVATTVTVNGGNIDTVGSIATLGTITAPITIDTIIDSIVVDGITNPVAVSGIANPITVASITSGITVTSVVNPIVVTAISNPVTVGSITAPVIVGSITSPVTVGSITTPLTVGSITNPVTVGSITNPIAISSVAGSIVVSGITSPLTIGTITDVITVETITNTVKTQSQSQTAAQAGSLWNGILIDVLPNPVVSGSPFVQDYLITATSNNLLVNTSSGVVLDAADLGTDAVLHLYVAYPQATYTVTPSTGTDVTAQVLNNNINSAATPTFTVIGNPSYGSAPAGTPRVLGNSGSATFTAIFSDEQEIMQSSLIVPAGTTVLLRATITFDTGTPSGNLNTILSIQELP
jgi:hypothetical protein